MDRDATKRPCDVGIILNIGQMLLYPVPNNMLPHDVVMKS